MDYYNKKIDEIYKEFNSSIDGLSTDYIKLGKEKYGINEIVQSKGKSNLRRFIDQFNDTMIIILIIVAMIMLIYGLVYSHDFTDTIVIIVVVMLNSIMGFLQEKKAEITLEGLKNYATDTVQVKRNSKIIVIDSKELLPGDIVFLNAGDKVPADCRIIDANLLMVDESPLTGESVPVTKNNLIIKGIKQIQDRANMIFSGSNITSGSCTAIVIKTGMDTELGTIATSLNTPYEVPTPLETKIKELSKVITLLIFLILIFIFFYSVYKNYDVMETIMLCVSLAVGAIPEGLPAVITISLSNGTNALLKKNTIVKQMKAVETLGSVDVICSDKTGTITENRMEIKNVDIYDDEMLNYIFALCNDTIINNNKLIGDPTETCLYKYLEDKNINVLNIRKKYKRIIAAPFDSERKLMSSVHCIGAENYILVKGSFSNLLSRCTYIYDDNKLVKLTEKKKEEIKELGNNWAESALRVMCYAYKKVKELPTSVQDCLDEENNLILVGVTGIIDPPRKSVKDSVLKCRKAGIRPVMITGDSLITATAIACDIGIIDDKKEGILGSELDKYTDSELLNIVSNYYVYARVSPIHKERIVKAYETLGKVVAMTGDGVNDAPAIKDAHVGIGMGITGTDVTKSVADIILLDDSFSTIVDSIEEGRRIFTNIRNNIVYSLSSNIAEVLIVLIGMFTGNVILLPIHILFIDLITDSIPSIALSFEKSEAGIMNKKPRPMKKPLFTPFIISCIVSSAVLETIFASITYFIVSSYFSNNIASTLALLSIVMQEIIYAISCRNLKYSFIKQGIFSNKIMNWAIIIIVLIECIFFLTGIGSFVNIATVELKYILCVVLINLISFIIYEALKPVLRTLFKD